MNTTQKLGIDNQIFKINLDKHDEKKSEKKSLGWCVSSDKRVDIKIPLKNS